MLGLEMAAYLDKFRNKTRIDWDSCLALGVL